MMRKTLNGPKQFFKDFFTKLFEDEEGQAVVEYILMIVFALAIVAVIGSSFKKTLMRMWDFYIRQISAACPGCPPNPSYRFR